MPFFNVSNPFLPLSRNINFMYLKTQPTPILTELPRSESYLANVREGGGGDDTFHKFLYFFAIRSESTGPPPPERWPGIEDWSGPLMASFLDSIFPKVQGGGIRPWRVLKSRQYIGLRGGGWIFVIIFASVDFVERSNDRVLIPLCFLLREGLGGFSGFCSLTIS